MVASGSVQDGGIPDVDGGTAAYDIARLLRFDADLPSGSTFACATVPLSTFTAASAQWNQDDWVAVDLSRPLLVTLLPLLSKFVD